MNGGSCAGSVPTRALVRAPGREIAACELTFLDRAPIDPELAIEQHAGFARALESLGLAVDVLPALAGHPDAPFVEDTAIVLDDVAVLTRPGAETRRGEVAAIEPVLAALRPLERIEAPHTLDGGDVLAIEDVLYVGLSARTAHGGMKVLAHTLLGYGYRIKAVHVKGCLHLKTACTYLGRDTLLVNADWFDVDRLAGFERIAVDEREPFGANVLKVGDALLCSSAAPRTADRIAARGFDVHLVDISEFHKAEAGLTCLALLASGA